MLVFLWIVLLFLRFRLFQRKTFSVVKCFQMQMISRKTFVFPVFICILENASKNILQCCAKDREEVAGGETCVFGKWFTKKLGVNHFPNFNKEFSGQRKLFSV